MTRLDVSPDVETAAQPAGAGRWDRVAIAPGLAVLVVLAAAAMAIASLSDALSPLVIGTVLGAVAANVLVPRTSWQPGIRFGSRRVLRAGIVLLGFRLSLGDVADLGAAGLVVVAVVVAVTFLGTRWFARRIGVSDDLGLLVATGYSICGASAIAAVDGVVKADEEDTAYAITLVTLCGTLSIFVLPLLADPLGFAGETFGAWVGGAVHDVGQVVATSAVEGDRAVAAATVVKLTRVVLLAPLVAAVAIARRRSSAGAGTDVTDRPPLVPLFVVGFLAAVALRSSDWLGGATLGLLADAEKLLLTVALVGLGMGVRVDKMRQLGGRPLLLGGVSWMLVAATAAIGTSIAL